jgi:hypothetical protein
VSEYKYTVGDMRGIERYGSAHTKFLQIHIHLITGKGLNNFKKFGMKKTSVIE